MILSSGATLASSQSFFLTGSVKLAAWPPSKVALHLQSAPLICRPSRCCHLHVPHILSHRAVIVPTFLVPCSLPSPPPPPSSHHCFNLRRLGLLLRHRRCLQIRVFYCDKIYIGETVKPCNFRSKENSNTAIYRPCQTSVTENLTSAPRPPRLG